MHIINQLRKAHLSMQPKEVWFKDGGKHAVSSDHAAKVINKYNGIEKPADKDAFQKEIAASHEAMKKHI
jgi:hypothetical protein